MRLVDVSYRPQYRPGAESWIHPLTLEFAEGAINVLLGATLAGKTSLMRLMAGLDRPTAGKIFASGRDVTGVPVRRRKLAMVYQQFINYPSLTVYDNIASPLQMARMPDSEIRQRVTSLAERLRLTPFLDRLPASLSGGQQQRTALARALAKDTDLLLLDEPLVNLDYKLREELRDELTQLFSERRTTVVYATTEPQEALQLGGHTALLDRGRLLQFGRTTDIFRRPATLEAARAFSDPPLNVIAARMQSGIAIVADGIELELPRFSADAPLQEITLGLRAHQFRIAPTQRHHAGITGRVDLAEISGSETYLHLSRDHLSLVAQLPGVHDLPLGAACTLYLDPADLYGFHRDGTTLFAPD